MSHRAHYLILTAPLCGLQELASFHSSHLHLGPSHVPDIGPNKTEASMESSVASFYTSTESHYSFQPLVGSIFVVVAAEFIHLRVSVKLEENAVGFNSKERESAIVVKVVAFVPAGFLSSKGRGRQLRAPTYWSARD